MIGPMKAIWKKGGAISVYPTTRGWTVRALLWTQGTDEYLKGFKDQRWCKLKDEEITEHVLLAKEWLEMMTQ